MLVTNMPVLIKDINCKSVAHVLLDKNCLSKCQKVTYDNYIIKLRCPDEFFPINEHIFNRFDATV